MLSVGPTSREEYQFDPRALGSLIVWNDASTYTGALSGGSWSNRSYNPKHTMNYGGSPTYVTAATAGLNFGVFQFQTTDSQVVAPVPYIHSGMTLVFLSRKASGTGRVFQATTGGQNILYGYWGTTTGFKNQLYINGWLIGPGSTTNDNLWDIYSIRVTETGGWSFYRNGTVIGRSDTGVPLPAMNGLGTNASGVFSGETSAYQMAEVLLYDTCVSIQDAFALEGYLAWKWGLVASLDTNHPFKSNPPTQTVFTPDLFYITPRVWYDFADQKTYVQLSNTSNILKYQTKGSAGVPASFWPGQVGFLPTVGATALNTLSTARFTNNQQLYTSSLAMSSSNKAVFILYQATSNVSTSATGLTNPIPATEFFMDLAQQGGGSCMSAGMSYQRTAPNANNIYGYAVGASGVAVNVNAGYGVTPGAPGRFPIATGWVLQGCVDAQNTTSNANRQTMYSACNINQQYYWTGAQLSNNVVATYASDARNTNLNVAHSTSTARHTGVEVAEVLWYDALMLTNDSTRIEGYLGWKWGLQNNFSTTFAFSRIPPRLSSGFNGTKSNYFGTAQAVTYLPLQTNIIDIGTFPQIVTSNGTSMVFGTVGGKTGISFPNSTSSWLSMSNQFQPPFTWCMWLYQNNASYYTAASFTNVAVNLPTLQFDTDGQQRVFMATANVTNQTWTSAIAATGTGATTWYSVALAVSSSQGVLYINGTSNTTLNGALPFHSRGGYFFLGKSGDNARAFSGYMRHFTFFNRILSASEISTWHTNTT